MISFVDIVYPLHRISERNAVFRWTMECETAFTTLRHYLISSPVLAYLDFPTIDLGIQMLAMQLLVESCHKALMERRELSYVPVRS